MTTQEELANKILGLVQKFHKNDYPGWKWDLSKAIVDLRPPQVKTLGEEEIKKVLKKLAYNCYLEGIGKLDTTIASEVCNAMEALSGKIEKKEEKHRLVDANNTIEKQESLTAKETLLKEIEKLVDLAYITSDLQYIADIEAINKLQVQMLKDYWRCH